jgi:predicted nucleic acid-binding protein
VDCVVDASVAVKLLVQEDMSDAADALFATLAHDDPPRFYVPDYFYAECANVLWKHVRHYGYPEDLARRNLADVCALALTSVPVSGLVDAAFVLAVKRGIAVYDAIYVALGQALRVPLVTADAALCDRLAGSDEAIIWLGNMV